MQMAQPHLASSSPFLVRPAPHASQVTLSPPTLFVRDVTSATDTDADFRAGLLSATPHLRAFAMSLTGQREAADDLVQDTLLRALQYPDRFEPGTKLQAWLFTILRNIFYSGHRKWRREVEDVDGLYAAKLSTAPEQLGCVEFAALHSALAKLSDEQREAVILVGAEGYSYEQVAEICGTKLGTIKSRVNRARKRLAELLGYDEIEAVGPDGVTRAALGPSRGSVLA
jgi:RNA polymerase sigma-70 factor (ECF subfamily)